METAKIYVLHNVKYGCIRVELEYHYGWAQTWWLEGCSSSNEPESWSSSLTWKVPPHARAQLEKAQNSCWAYSSSITQAQAQLVVLIL